MPAETRRSRLQSQIQIGSRVEITPHANAVASASRGRGTVAGSTTTRAQQAPVGQLSDGRSRASADPAASASLNSNKEPTTTVSDICENHDKYREMMMSTSLLPLLALLASHVANAESTEDPGNSRTHFLPNRTALVDLFEWTFDDVAAECRDFLGPRGFAGVQLSPVTEHRVGPAMTWCNRFQPVSYAVASRSGDADAFQAMARACNAAGVRVYVTVVLNHMAAATGDEEGAELRGSGGSKANISALDFPAVPYGPEDFHAPCPVADYGDGHEVRNCQLDGQPDLDHSRAGVRERVVALLDRLVDLGAAGFHVDAAKYMWPIDLKNIFRAVKNLNSAEFGFPEGSRPFFYQDVLDLGTEAISKTEYSGYGVVTEYLYAAEMATIFGGQVPLSALINWGPAMGFLRHHEALVFVDTPQSQRGRLPRLGHIRLLTHRERNRFVMATAFMLAHPYGAVKRVSSSYRFPLADPDQGPPTDESDGATARIRSPQFDAAGQCTAASGWVCEHRWSAVANMVELAAALDEVQDNVINFQTDGPQHVAFCRGHRAFVALNNDATRDFEASVATCLAPGVYCDVVSGGRVSDGGDCLGRRVAVDAEGDARISLKAPKAEEEDGEDPVEYSVLVICVGSRLQDEGSAPLETSRAAEGPELSVAPEASDSPVVAAETIEEVPADAAAADEAAPEAAGATEMAQLEEEKEAQGAAGTEAQEAGDVVEDVTEDARAADAEEADDAVGCPPEVGGECAAAAVVGDPVGSDVEDVPAEVMAAASAAAAAAKTRPEPVQSEAAPEAAVDTGFKGSNPIPSDTFTFSPLH